MCHDSARVKFKIEFCFWKFNIQKLKLWRFLKNWNWFLWKQIRFVIDWKFLIMMKRFYSGVTSTEKLLKRQSTNILTIRNEFQWNIFCDPKINEDRNCFKFFYSFEHAILLEELFSKEGLMKVSITPAIKSRTAFIKSMNMFKAHPRRKLASIR